MFIFCQKLSERHQVLAAAWFNSSIRYSQKLLGSSLNQSELIVTIQGGALWLSTSELRLVVLIHPISGAWGAMSMNS